MPFEIGDRVQLNSETEYDETRHVGLNNIGTVFGINERDEYCLINWDNKGPETYVIDPQYPNQWNVSFKYLELIYDPVKSHPNYKVIRKVISMNKKRKALGYAI